MPRGKSEDREKAILHNIVDLLVREIPGIKGIILFGSRARGDYGPWSDYDLLIIADFKEPYLQRISTILEILKHVSIPIEPHPYTLEEALSMLHKLNPTIIDALEEGIILHRTEKLKRLIEEYKKLKKRIERTTTTIRLKKDT